MKKLILIIACLIMTSCVTKPEGIEPVQNFDVTRYMGQWYEIARIDHSFEEGLTHGKAVYSLNDNGTVKVINSGYNSEKKERESATAIAKFVDQPTEGFLKVSFFKPFYGSYIIFDLDENYKYAYVTGSSRDYLWLLSRTSKISKEQKQRFLEKVKSLGFDTNKIIWVNQGKH